MGRYKITNPHLPATPDQRRHALRLGIEVPEVITMGEISKLIDEATPHRKPTDRMLALAADLKLDVSPDATFDMVGKMLDTEISERTMAAVRDNPNLRGGKQITYQGWPFLLFEISTYRGTFMAELRPITDKRLQGYRVHKVPLWKLASCQAPTDDEIRMVLEA